MAEIKFYPPSGKESVTVGLTSGHMAVVNAEGTVLDKLFHAEAIAQGCRLTNEDDAVQDEAFDRTARIREVIEDLLDSNNPDAFTANGLPQTDVLSKACGFRVTSSERDAVWAEVSADMDK